MKSLTILRRWATNLTSLSATPLGLIAQLRGHREEAGVWYMKSLAIFEALGDEPNKATALGSWPSSKPPGAKPRRRDRPNCAPPSRDPQPQKELP